MVRNERRRSPEIAALVMGAVASVIALGSCEMYRENASRKKRAESQRIYQTERYFSDNPPEMDRMIYIPRKN